MTDQATKPVDFDLSFPREQLGALQMDMSKLSTLQLGHIETDLSILRTLLNALQSDVTKLSAEIAVLHGKLEPSFEMHERIAALEARVDNLPPRDHPPGNNGRSRF